MKLNFINENVARLISPMETFLKTEKILFDNNLLKSYGHFTGNQRIKLFFPNFYAVGTEKVNEYVKSNPFISYGKGFTTESALASCLMEFVERYSMFKYLKTGIQEESTIKDLKNSKDIFYGFGNCLIPNKKEILDLISIDELFSYKFRWHKCFRVRGYQDEVLAPMFFWNQICGSNGIAAGNTIEEALLHGIYECIERHCMAITLQNKVTLPAIPEEFYENFSDVQEALGKLKNLGITYKILDASYDFNVPVVALLCNFPDGLSSITFGVAGRLSEAIMRNITESSQLSDHPQLLVLSHEFNYCYGVETSEKIIETFDEDINVELEKLYLMLMKKKLDLYYFDCTDSELNIPTVAIYIDGLKFDDATNGKDGKLHLNNMYSIVNAMQRKGVF